MYAFCQDLPGITEDVARRIEDEIGRETVDGCVAHVAGPYDGGWRIIDVWEDQAALDRFREARLFPAVAKVTGSAGPPAGLEVRDVTSVFARV
jgi:quinol monooxygenase YgiN